MKKCVPTAGLISELSSCATSAKFTNSLRTPLATSSLSSEGTCHSRLLLSPERPEW
jgi:hypothetical protein